MIARRRPKRSELPTRQTAWKSGITFWEPTQKVRRCDYIAGLEPRGFRKVGRMLILS